MPRDFALEVFKQAVNHPELPISLGRAALLIGLFEYPDLDVTVYESRLDHLASVAKPLVIDAADPPVALARFLYQEQGFTGNTDDYMDPRNSFLNEVLDRRLGIPITLSVLYLEVSRRLEINAAGVGLPGHFIVRAAMKQSQEPIYIDAFHGGSVMTVEDCRERVNAITQGKLQFSESFLNPVDARFILIRILNNLKNAYASRKDLERAVHVVERLLAVDTNNLEELRNLGFLYSALGQHWRAVQLLERYLEILPNAPDAATVRQTISSLYADVARWN